MPCKWYGGLAEWSIAAVLKTVELKGSVGSNPTASAKGVVVQLVRIFACHANGRGFESRPHRNTNSPLAQLVRAFDC